jgi:anti-sigma regulatory factor (Ser/Thr protein kinase)
VEVMGASKVSRILSISDVSGVGECRRQVADLASDCQFSETEMGQIAIVVTELANNLVKHAQRGDLIVRILELSGTYGLEIISADLGPGVLNISDSMRDGYSTAGSPGTGMGAIKRLSHVFDIYSVPGKGLIVLTQFWSEKFKKKKSEFKSALECGVICFPNRGELVCGDNWAAAYSDHRNYVAVFDGLGHGLLAAEASDEGVQVFDRNLDKNPQAIVSLAHDNLKKTRGAAGAIAMIDSKKENIEFSGVGNISAAVIQVDLTVRRMVSHNGTLGLLATRIHKFDYAWSETSTLLMHSDGLATHWKIENYPGLYGKHPSILAALLFRDYKRGTDDVTIVVGKEQSSVACL